MTAHDSLLIPPGCRSECGRLRMVRICRVQADGLLLSPHRGTPWQGPVMRANGVAADAAVAGRAGLHAVWDRGLDYQPETASEAVVHALADGRAVVSETAARVERMAVHRVVLHCAASDETLAAVRSRYRDVPVVRAAAELTVKRRLKVTLDADGTVIVARYRNGKLHGRREEQRADGTVLIERYRAGKLHGRREVRRADGTVIVEHYRAGLLHGRREDRHADGMVLIARYRAGLLHGRREERRADGSVVIEHYRNGLLA